jgi:hypothetical protein
MTRVFVELIPLFLASLVWLALWRILFRHLAQLQSKLSLKIREKVLPDVDRSNTTFITLSSAAVVLTFSILQIWSNKPMVKQYYLVISWVGFALTVLTGALLSIGLYIYRTHYHCVIKDFEGSLDEEGKMKKQHGDTLKVSLDKSKTMERLLFSLITGCD